MEFFEIEINYNLHIYFSFVLEANNIICDPVEFCPYIIKHYNSKFSSINKENILQYVEGSTHIESVGELENGDFLMKINFSSNGVELYAEGSDTGNIDPDKLQKIISRPDKKVIDNIEALAKNQYAKKFSKGSWL